MPWFIEYNDALDCVVHTFTGRHTGKDIRNATTSGMAAGKLHKTHKYLIDLRKLEYAGSISRLMDLPTVQYREEGLSRQSRIAIVLPESQKAKQDAMFYETICVNRGWNVKCFSSRVDALNWLQCH